jgi:hypothetical protein
MILVVRPLGEGFRERARYWVQASLYSLGLAGASAVVGYGIGLVGLLFRQATGWTPPLWIAGALALLFSLREVGVIKFPIPQRKWQVPISWVHKHRYLGSLAYGVTIGLGYLTYIPYPGFWILQAISFLSATPWVSTLLGALYGLGRALPVLTVGLTRASHLSTAPFNLFGFVIERQRSWRWFSVALLLGSSVVFMLELG